MPKLLNRALTRAIGEAPERLLPQVIALSAVLSLGVLQYALHRNIPEPRSSQGEAQPVPYIGLTLDPAFIRAFLGTRLLVADLVWVDNLVKSDIKHEGKPFTTFYQAARVVTALDEDNVYAYYFAGLYLSVVKDDIKGATSILTEGAQYLDRTQSQDPNAWKVYFALGYNLIFEEADVEGGSYWIEKAAGAPNAPLYARKLAEHIKSEDGRLEVGARLLDEMFRKATSDEVRDSIKKKMLDIAAKQELLDLNRRFDIFLSTTEAYALPKKKAFQMFMNSNGRSSRSILGKVFDINRLGKIIAK